MEKRILKTVEDWKNWLKDQPNGEYVVIDMNPINGGSFEFLKVVEFQDYEHHLQVQPTHHCE